MLGGGGVLGGGICGGSADTGAPVGGGEEGGAVGRSMVADAPVDVGALGAEGVASALSPMVASIPPTSTMSSSAAEIARRTPDAGAGISVSTLSVDTSSSGSSAATVSPTCFNHRVTVPSVTLSPSWGITTGVDTSATSSRCLGSSCRAGRPLSATARHQECECSGLPARARWASPMASLCVGWAWIKDATSAGVASQL